MDAYIVQYTHITKQSFQMAYTNCTSPVMVCQACQFHLFMCHSTTCLNTGASSSTSSQREQDSSYLGLGCLTVLKTLAVLWCAALPNLLQCQQSQPSSILLYHGNLWSFLFTLLNALFLSSCPITFLTSCILICSASPLEFFESRISPLAPCIPWPGTMNKHYKPLTS